MHNTKKRIAALLVAVVFCFCLYPTRALSAATSGECGDNLTWKLDSEGTLTISGTGDMYDNTGFWNPQSVKKVVISKGVTSIGLSAFEDCTKLTSVTIPDTVTLIALRAFTNCTSLKSITIPESVTDIYAYAFAYCESLTSVKFPSGLIYIGGALFFSCYSLQSVTLNDNVSIIYNGAFSKCINLTNITIPRSVNKIEEGAFSDCTSLKSVTIEKDLHDACDSSVFEGCSNISFHYYDAHTHNIVLVPEKKATCTQQGDLPFYKCTICNRMYSDDQGKHPITEPDHTVALGHYLEEVPETPPTKTSKGNIQHYKCSRCGKLFSDAKGKKEIQQEDTVIPVLTHYLTYVKAKAPTCTEAGNKAYYMCEDPDCGCGKYYSDLYGQHEISADSVVEPATGHDLQHHPAKAATCTEAGNIEYWECTICGILFKDSAGTDEIEAKDTVAEALGHDTEHVIHHAAKAPTYDDDGNIEHYECPRCNKSFSDAGCTSELKPEEIIVPKKGAPGLGETVELDDYKYVVTNPSTDGSGLLTFTGVVNPMANVSIPATVKIKGSIYTVNRVAANALNGDTTLKTVIIGANVAEIEANAFYCCSSLVKVSGGAKLKKIGANAFARCPKLSSFTISSKVLSNIGPYCFNKDSKLKTISIKGTTKLTKGGVKKSLKGSKVKTVKVKKSKVKKYKKFFTKKNAGRKVKVKK